MKKKLMIIGIIALLLIVGLSGCNDVTTKRMTIVTFTVKPNSIVLGQNANLSWVVTGSDTIVNIDNGIGNVSLTGYRIISPTETTIYKLTATNNTSIKNATIEIIVEKLPLTDEEKIVGTWIDPRFPDDSFNFLSNGTGLWTGTSMLWEIKDGKLEVTIQTSETGVKNTYDYTFSDNDQTLILIYVNQPQVGLNLIKQ